MTRSGGSLILVSSRYIAWLRSPLPSKLQVLHVWQISSMKALLEEFLLLKKYDVYQLKEIWAIREQINRSPIIKIPGVTEGIHQGKMKTCQRHQVHVLPTVIRTSWNQTLPLASKKLRKTILMPWGKSRTRLFCHK